MSTAQLISQSFASPEQQIAEITGRLGRRYPREQITLAELEARVRQFYRRFDTVHVRTYVAILVERLVRRSIDVSRKAGNLRSGAISAALWLALALCEC